MPTGGEEGGGVVEIEVVGGYDQDLADHSQCRPIPDWDVPVIKGLTSREQVRTYLLSLPDELLIKTFRHIQYRYLEDGSLWDTNGSAAVHRTVGSPERVSDTQVRLLAEVDAETAADYARGWRPLGPPKVVENACEQCAGHGICPYCLGSGSAS